MKKLVNTQSNNGFTLVELLVALLISGILLGTVSSVFLMSQKLYTRGGDVSYKQKSITNVETDIQNALSIASATGVITSTSPGGNYSIGFNNNGDCVEVISTVEYKLDQISQIKFTVVNVNTMTYEIIPTDTTMSTLTGGVVMNNVKVSPAFGSVTFNSGNKNKYLNITYETGT